MARRHALLAFALGSAACTELAPGTDRLDQGVGSASPDAGLPPVDPAWACLGARPVSEVVALRPAVEVSLRIIDISTRMPPPEVSVKACNKLDVGCLMPRTSDISVAADGLVHVSVEQTFSGFFEVTCPGCVPTLFFVNEPVMVDRQEAFSVVTLVGLEGLAASGGVTLDPQLGHLLVRTFDCEGTPAAGVEFSNDKGGQPFTFVMGLPQVGTDITTTDGLGGYVNVPVGFVVLQGVELGRNLISGTSSVLVRAGSLTYADVRPVRP